MTNADKIRNMTDEELCENMRDSICAIVPEGMCLAGKIDCDQCIMNWLKQEVSE